METKSNREKKKVRFGLGAHALPRLRSQNPCDRLAVGLFNQSCAIFIPIFPYHIRTQIIAVMQVLEQGEAYCYVMKELSVVSYRPCEPRQVVATACDLRL